MILIWIVEAAAHRIAVGLHGRFHEEARVHHASRGAAARGRSPARAQQPAMPVIGFLGVGSPEAFADRVQAFRQGVREVGFIDGRDVAIEYHGLHGQGGPMPVLAAELVRRSVV